MRRSPNTSSMARATFLDSLPAPTTKNLPHPGEIADLVTRAGRTFRFEILVADDQFPIFYADEPPGIVVRISGLQAGIQNLHMAFAAQPVACGKRFSAFWILIFMTVGYLLNAEFLEQF